MSVERFLTVCCSYRHAVASVSLPDGSASRIFHLSYTVPILVFSFAFNVTRFFELRTAKQFTNVTESVMIMEEDYDQIDEYSNSSWKIYGKIIICNTLRDENFLELIFTIASISSKANNIFMG